MNIVCGGRAIVVAAVVGSVTACVPLPISHTDVLAPALIGHVQRNSGTPASALPISVSTSERCDRPIARGITDSSGGFRIAESTKRERWLWLTMFDFGQRPYWVCAGERDSIRIIYEGRIPLQVTSQIVDSLECRMDAPFDDARRIAPCGGRLVRW